MAPTPPGARTSCGAVENADNEDEVNIRIMVIRIG